MSGRILVMGFSVGPPYADENLSSGAAGREGEAEGKGHAPGAGGGARGRGGKPVRLLPRPGCLAGRDDLLTGLHVRLTSGADLRPRMVALCGLGYASNRLAGLQGNG